MRDDIMALALSAARNAAADGEVPVGAVVTGPSGEVLSVAANRMVTDCDPAAHAEMLALRIAAKQGLHINAAGRLQGCDLWVTLEPCAMCAAAAGLFRVRRLIFGAYDPKAGGVEHGPRVFATSPQLAAPEIIGGVREAESAVLLRAFFQQLRDRSTSA